MSKKRKIETISNPCINISIIECWKCKNDMIVPYYSNGIAVPLGPSGFTEQQIDIARNEGCILKESFSDSSETSFLAAVCPVCGNLTDNFFYHDLSKIPGDVQYFLDDKDDILRRIENKKLELRTHKKVDEIEYRNDAYTQDESIRDNPTNVFDEGICVLVEFENDRMFQYNCRFKVNLGDKVKVDGKMSDYIGEVVEIEGEWDLQQYMKEIVEVLPTDFEDNRTERLTQHKMDKAGNKEDELINGRYISGFSLEYRIIVDESDADSPINIWFNNFDLCNEKLEKIEYHSSATVTDDFFEANAYSIVSCEHYLGGEFTSTEYYAFDRLNTKKFYQSLDQSTDLVRLSEIIIQKFGGLRGLITLVEYCKEKDIKYSYTDLFRE